MLSTIDLKDARIEFKTSKDIKTLLQEAANSLGMDLSSFLVSTAIQRAKEVIKEDNILTLSKEEWKNFQSILDTPKKPTKALNDLMNLEGFDK
ncbi:MAG: Unknown protein [uncultured Sulfurovum sp.]|uniref:DUF1778 domain-containing protein n=1 Tax=uncultured Sulfurovum sp. TaxID=269237 RepID=A0A6S6S8E9_9BACT|nr:MAG: Unknown protein [uncultured Sulfurovum sp.]